ncbi:MAG: anhydro-N-acetylmuramic acid kinase [Bacteroidota bacterium]
MATEQQVLGIMSGSSLDGLDLAVCRIVLDAEGERLIPEWEILAAETDPYPPTWRARLRSAPALPGRELWRLHADVGRWIGRRAKDFLGRHPELEPSLVGSHGHTVFHDPVQAFTTQIGDGAALANALGLPVVAELRGADVAAGGQGAPLAPLADKYLLPEYGAFLNLGGIANLSVRQADGRYLAGDISGCCQVLDRLAAREGLAYDADGNLAKQGTLHPAVAAKLSALPYQDLPYPKSLDNGWVRDELWPVMAGEQLTTADALRTFSVWLADKIVADLGAVAGAKEGPRGKVLVTGGGAQNAFLLHLLQLTQEGLDGGFDFVIPDATTADFKEAALVALSAVLRQAGLPNAVASATGAPRDTVNGALFLPG